MAYTDIELVFFIFAKEFGWSVEYILGMEHRHFRMYLRELIEMYKAEECAKDGKKYVRPRKALSVREVDSEVKNLAKKLSAERNARNIPDKRD